MQPGEVIGLIAVVCGMAWVLRPLATALGRRLEGRHTVPDPQLLAEIEDLRARVADTEQLQGRMAELEERLDFTERLLSQHRQARLLPEGSES